MISQKRYDTGAGTWLEMNDAELALTQARLNFNQSIYDYMVADSLLGGVELLDTGIHIIYVLFNGQLQITLGIVPQARLNFNQSIYDYMVAKADLEKVLGNGQMN